MIAFLLGGGGCVSSTLFHRRLGAHSLLLLAAICMIAAVLTAPALAGAQATFTISVIVTRACTIATTPASATPTADGSTAVRAELAVGCGKGASTVSVGLSSAASGAHLYQDEARTIPWDSHAHVKALSAATTHASQPVAIYATLPNPSNGDADDTITATIDY